MNHRFEQFFFARRGYNKVETVKVGRIDRALFVARNNCYDKCVCAFDKIEFGVKCVIPIEPMGVIGVPNKRFAASYNGSVPCNRHKLVQFHIGFGRCGAHNDCHLGGNFAVHLKTEFVACNRQCAYALTARSYRVLLVGFFHGMRCTVAAHADALAVVKVFRLDPVHVVVDVVDGNCRLCGVGRGNVTHRFGQFFFARRGYNQVETVEVGRIVARNGKQHFVATFLHVQIGVESVLPIEPMSVSPVERFATLYRFAVPCYVHHFVHGDVDVSCRGARHDCNLCGNFACYGKTESVAHYRQRAYALASAGQGVLLLRHFYVGRTGIVI